MKFKKIKFIYLFFILILLYIPIILYIVKSFNFNNDGNVFKYYKSLFLNKNLLNSIILSLLISFLTLIISITIGFLTTYALISIKNKITKLILHISYWPIICVDIVLGIALLLGFSIFGIKLNFLTLLLSHILLSIPYVILILYPKMNKINKEIIESAKDLGANHFQIITKIVLPLIFPSILLSILIVFIVSFDEFIISYFISGQYNNFSTKLYSLRTIKPYIYALLGFIFFILFFIIIFINLYFFFKKKPLLFSSFNKIKKNFFKFFYFGKLISYNVLFYIKTISILMVLFGGIIFFSINYQRYNLTLLTWDGYFDDYLNEKFFNNSKIKLKFDFMENNEFGVVKTKTSDYDMIVLSKYIVENKKIFNNKFEKIDLMKNKNIILNHNKNYKIPLFYNSYSLMYHFNLNFKTYKDFGKYFFSNWNTKYKILLPKDKQIQFLFFTLITLNKAVCYNLEEYNEVEKKYKYIRNNFWNKIKFSDDNIDEKLNEYVKVNDMIVFSYTGDFRYLKNENKEKTIYDKFNFLTAPYYDLDYLILFKRSLKINNYIKKFLNFLKNDYLKNYFKYTFLTKDNWKKIKNEVININYLNEENMKIKYLKIWIKFLNPI